MNTRIGSVCRLALALGGTVVLAACSDGVGGLQGVAPARAPVVDPPNDPPQLSGTPPMQVIAGEPYLFEPQVSDPNGDELTFSVDALPPWAIFDGVGGSLSGTPSDADVGEYLGIIIRVSDGELSDDLGPFSITVEASPPPPPPPNQSPEITGTPPVLVTANDPYRFEPQATDPDGDDITFSVGALPAWASFDTTTGTLSGVPSDADVGQYPGIVISVSDGLLDAALAPFAIEVRARPAPPPPPPPPPPPNDPPTISGDPPLRGIVGSPYAFVPTAFDPNGDALTFSVANAPAWAAFDSGSGALSGTPGDADAGTTAGIVIIVSDGELSDALGPFSITVEPPPNAPPQISGEPPAQVMVGEPYRFQPDATDPDDDDLSFSIDSSPSWATFDAGTGTLSGTPGETDVGTFLGIVISVSDGDLSDLLGPFSITVEPAPNVAPQISGNPPLQVTAGEAYRFEPTASDADGDALTFSVVNTPAWASFDSASGVLSGTPRDQDEGVYPGIVITVSDGELTDSLGPFTVTVAPPANEAPQIDGQPPTQVVAESPYQFQPQASDPEGDALTFTITNLPSWATFDTGNGTLSGTPGETDVGAYPGIVITVSDGELIDSLGPFSITVEAPPNSPPQITGDPPSQATAGEPYQFTPVASDPEGDELTFSVVNPPPWTAFDPATGTLSGTPEPADQGEYTGIIIIVSDGDATDSLGPFAITVEGEEELPPNEPPEISGTPPAQITVGQRYEFQPVASDPEGQDLVFSITNRPTWAAFDTLTGALAGTPGEADQGIFSAIVISVSDGELSASLGPFSITVEAPPNEPPEIAGDPVLEVIANEPYAFQPVASDPEGDELTFSIANAPAWAAFDINTGRLAGTPTEADQGEYPGIVIIVSDGELTDSLDPFTITVQPPPNSPPDIAGDPPLQVVAGETYRFEPTASDPDGDDVTFSIANQPSWATFDSDTGALFGTPSDADQGEYSGIVIIVSDGELSDALGPFSITVEPPPNAPPQLEGDPPAQVIAGDAYLFQPVASDPDGDDLTFSIANRPSWASFDTNTGELSGTPSDGDEGLYGGIVVTVSDGDLTDSIGPFSITVEPPPNDAPQITGDPPLQVRVGELYLFEPQASDADGDDLTFSITNPPSWATFDTDSGALSGSPEQADEGPFPGILISVSDGELSDSLGPFTITVLPPPNAPPEIGGDPASRVVAGEPYLFTPVASDPEGDDLTFSIVNTPGWASFDPGSGTLSGTPSDADQGFYADIIISVSDGDLSASLGPFSITVDAPPNAPPDISGQPPTQVVAGESYSFVPTASDPDGDELTFSIEAQPSWASFEADTGTLSGTPSADDQGEYPGIVITVTDGEFSDALGPFSITVEPPPTRIDEVTLAVASAESSVDLQLAAFFGGDVVSTFGTGTFPLGGSLELEVEYAGTDVLSVTFIALTLDYLVDPETPVSIFIDVDDNGMITTVEARFPYDETINPGNPVDAFDPQLWLRADGGGETDIGTPTGTGGTLTLDAPRYAFVGTANTFNSPAAPDGFPLQLNPYNRFSRDTFDGAPAEPRVLDGLVSIEGCDVLFHGSFLAYAVAGSGLVQSALVHSGIFRASAELPDC